MHRPRPAIKKLVLARKRLDDPMPVESVDGDLAVGEGEGDGGVREGGGRGAGGGSGIGWCGLGGKGEEVWGGEGEEGAGGLNCAGGEGQGDGLRDWKEEEQHEGQGHIPVHRRLRIGGEGDDWPPSGCIDRFGRWFFEFFVSLI